DFVRQPEFYRPNRKCERVDLSRIAGHGHGVGNQWRNHGFEALYMNYQGRVLRFGDNVNTDDIIAEHYKNRSVDLKEIAKYVFADFDPEFLKRMKPGDIIVAGKNFGSGSAREAAPQALKIVGVSCIVAISFARIFFR